jgi:hypothetical protein
VAAKGDEEVVQYFSVRYAIARSPQEPEPQVVTYKSGLPMLLLSKNCKQSQHMLINGILSAIAQRTRAAHCSNPVLFEPRF